MAYGNNDTEYEAGAPKKADVLIRSTQHIAAKQEELSEQTKRVSERLEEIAEMFSKNNQDSSYIVKQSSEIFNQLQSENSALKQELLYLAKQSENIYAGLAEKITELSDQAKTREDALTALVDRINDVSEHTLKSGESYSGIVDKMTELAEQNKRNEKLFAELNEKLEAISEHTKKSEKAYGELSDKIVVSDKGDTSEIGSAQLIDKINYISEQLRRSEGAHSMLADKFEILSMRVEQFGFESAKGSSNYNGSAPAPAAYPVPVHTDVKAEIDYDKLAEKVAEIISAREVISPDYIASRVAEQVVIPEIQTANVKVSVDTHDIAKQVVELMDEKSVRPDNMSAQTVANVSIDEESLADRIVQRIGGVKGDSVTAVADVDEEELAERIARKVGGMRQTVVAPVSSVSGNINEEELADSIALKVGSLKAEDFEILVDDEGCTSISKEIVHNLDYNVISNIIADKLRDALDLAAVNAPDYEEMAERISEKITVAGINEAAIADKAAAALSNYLPEIDTDEIADKITGAVIDVVSAIPHPTVDSEAICNTISEKLIESQEGHDYDIVIDDEGISRITELVTEEIEKGTGARFDKVEEDISKITELVSGEIEKGTDARFDKVEEDLARIRELLGRAEETAASEQAVAAAEVVRENVQSAVVEQDYTKLTDLVATEIERGTSSRFDKVEGEVAKLTELVSSLVVEDGFAESNYSEGLHEDDYAAISEVVATEIERGIEGVSTRISGIEENVAKISEYLATSEEAVEEEEYEEDFTALSEVVATEIEKGVASKLTGLEENVATRLTGLEENVAKLTEYLTAEEEVDEQYDEEAVDEGEEEVDDYTVLSEVVAAEIEKGVASRLTGLEENVAKLTEYLTAEEEVEEEQYDEEAVEDEEEEVDDYTALSEVVAAEIEKGVASKLSGIEENVSTKLSGIEENVATKLSGLEENVASRLSGLEHSVAKISEYINANNNEAACAEIECEHQTVITEDYSMISEVVAAEIEKGVASRLSGVEENIFKVEESVAKLTDYISSAKAVGYTQSVGADEPNEHVETKEYVEIDDCTVLSDVIAAEIEKGVSTRLTGIEENVAKLAEYLTAEEVAATEYHGEEQPVRTEEQDYTVLSEVVAAEIEKGVASKLSGLEESVASRLSGLEENVAKLSEYLTTPEEVVEDEEYEEDYTVITEAVANEIEKGIEGVTTRISGLEESVAKLSEYLTSSDEAVEEEVKDYTAISEVVANEIEKGIEGVSTRISDIEENVAKISEYLAAPEEEAEGEEYEEEYEEDYTALSEAVAAEIEKGVASRLSGLEDNVANRLTGLEENVASRLNGLEENVAKLSEYLTTPEEVEEEAVEDYTVISEVVATEIEKGVTSKLSGLEDNVASRLTGLEENVASRLNGLEENVAKLSEYISSLEVETEEVQSGEAEVVVNDYTALSEVVATEIEKGVASKLSGLEENVASRLTGLEENVAKLSEYITAEEAAEGNKEEEKQTDNESLSEVVASEIEKGVASRLSTVEENIAKVEQNITKVEDSIAKITERITSEQVRTAKGVVSRIAALEEHIASEQVRTAKGVVLRLSTAEEKITKAVEENIAKLSNGSTDGSKKLEGLEELEDYATLSEIVATEIDRGISFRLDSVEENVARLAELVESNVENQTAAQTAEADYTKLSDVVAEELEKNVKDRFDKVEGDIAKLTEIVEVSAESNGDDRIVKLQDDLAIIKEMLSNGIVVASETAAAQSAAPVVEEEPEEEEALVTVSDVVEADDEETEEEAAEEASAAEAVAEPSAEAVTESVPEPVAEHTSEPVKEKETIREFREYVKEKETLIILPSGNNQSADGQPVSEPAKQPIDIEESGNEEFEEDEEEEDEEKEGFSIDVLDMDAFSDDELMPGELSDYADGVDFANMMKFKRSFIARIIQSNDEYKQYYGEVKHALLSYKKVNSNVAWGAERFNKGRETIARLKIRGKTLCLYLALDPNEYKTSVYHHLDVSDNKSVAGTPMMVKIKSNLGVRKAIRLIDEMLAKRNGERKEIPERDYAAMYPYETIEELIEEGLVKDVRKK